MKPQVKEITVKFVVESDVTPENIANLFNDDMPDWMVGYEHLSESPPREPTDEEGESMCWNEAE